MLAIRPITTDFALAYRHDEAFDTKVEGYNETYDRCVNTLDFSPITRPGQRPTLFHFKLPTDEQMRRLFGVSEVSLHGWLMVRMCLVSISGAEQETPIEPERDREFPQFGKLVPIPVINAIASASRSVDRPPGEIIDQLGKAVLNRYSGDPFFWKD